VSDQSAPDENEAGLAYGSLFMHQGDKIDKAEEQIVQLSKKNPLGWFFDIIHTRNQTPAAADMMVEVVKLIRREMPKLKDGNIVVRANINGKARQALALAGQLTSGIKTEKRES
jgi:hypothetical protein